MAKEQVRFDILINAKAAILQLRQMSEAAKSNEERVAKFSEFLASKSKQWNVPLKQLLNTFRQLNAEIAKSHGKPIFGNVGGQNIFNMSQDFLKSAQAAGRFSVSADGVVQSVNRTSKAMDGAGQAASGFRHRIDLVRTALGTLAAVTIFQILTGITNFFQEASKQARQLEETIYRLSNAERNLSLEGIEISMKGLEEGIARIQKKLPIFSREDIAQLVGTIAVSTKQLGFTEEEILQLTEIVALLNIQSEKTEDLATTRSHVLSSILSSNSRGIAELGVSFNEFALKQKAVELGYIKIGDSLKGLTDDEKAQIKFAILRDSVNLDSAESLERLNEFLETNTAKVQSSTAAWKDLLTSVGSIINTLLPNMSELFTGIQKDMENVTLTLMGVIAAFQAWKTVMASGINPFDAEARRKLFEQEYQKNVGELAGKFFPDPAAIKDEFVRGIIEPLVEIKETATDANAALKLEAEADTEALDELEQEIEDIAIDAQNAKEDLDILLGQKQEDLEIRLTQKEEDIDLEYLQKAEDAQIDYANKIEDINLDAQNKIEEAKEKARDDELKAEAEFQLKLQQLREDFLFDLEEALHARDARQVLRLIKQYNLDKKQLEDKKALDDQFRQESLEADLENIEQERQQRLEAAAREYQQKLQQLALAKQRELEELARWKAREEEELARWYQREQEEIERNTERKLQKLIDGYIDEGKIHEENQGKIHDILVKWFGKNTGLVDDLMAYTSAAFSQMAQSAASVFSGINQYGGVGNVPYGPPPPPAESEPYVWGGRYAKGGQFVATRPTRIEVGEGGMPELVSVIPLSKILGGSLGVNGSPGSNGINGEIRIAVDLSPDLEGRIIENAMDATAEVVTKINRSKV